MATWTRVTDPEAAITVMPPWFASRMMASRGSYGFLLATGDVLRVSRVTAVHVSSAGSILLDVLLDHAGVPGGVDTAWQPKQFLGTPVPGASLATLNLAQVVLAVEFMAAEIAETAKDLQVPSSDTVVFDLPVVPAVISNGTEPIAPPPISKVTL